MTTEHTHTSVPQRFTAKVVPMTGAGGGIGRAVALRFAAEGAHVAVNDVRAEAVQAVVDEIRVAGGRALTAPADVGKHRGRNHHA